MPISDDIMARLKEIEEAVQQNQTVNWEQAAADFEQRLQTYADAQIKEKLDARPMRRVPGALVGPDGTKITPSNRYHKHLAAFEKDGYLKEGTLKAMPIDLWMAKRLMDRAHEYYPEKAARGASDELNVAVKALTSTGTGSGDEYVPTDLASEVWMDMFLASRIASTITTTPMPTDPFDIPLGLGAITWRKGGQNTPTTHSDPSTAKSTLTSTELVTEQRWSYTLDEDTVVAIMPLLRTEITRSAGEMIDDFALNADNTSASTGNINSDDTTPPSDSYYLSDGQNGIRRQWLIDNTAQTINAGGDALADQDIVDALGKMDKYAVDPQSCAITCGIQTYLKGFLSSASGAPGANLLTIDKFGPSAILLTGQLAAYRGIPVIPSSVHRLSAADGKLDAATPANNTLGNLTIYNRMMWYMGFRRQLLIEADRFIQSRQVVMVTSFRQAIGARVRSGGTHTAGVRNVLV